MVNLESVPRMTLTHVGSMLAGFILAMWCNTPNDGTRLPYEPKKPGFVITVKSSSGGSVRAPHLSSKTTVWALRRRDPDRGGLCQLPINDVTARPTNRFIQLMGDNKKLENIVRLVSEVESGHALITDDERAKDHPPCPLTAVVKYGQNI